jgi:integrase
VPHILHRSNTYYFNRRVPLEVKDFEKRKFIRYSLKTDSLKKAVKLAAVENSRLEEYWSKLIASSSQAAHENYRQVVERSQHLGLTYQTNQQLAEGQLSEIIQRLLLIAKQPVKYQLEAALGGVVAPEILLSDALSKYWELSKDVLLDKSQKQIKKWQNPRKLAIKNLLACIGDKPLSQLTGEDILKFRNWWINRIEINGKGLGAADKDFIHSKVILRTVAKHFKISIDVKHFYEGISINGDSDRRKAFATDFIVSKLLNKDLLSGMSEQNRALLKIFAETGTSVSEITKVLPEDIFLNAEIPYISLNSRKKNKLKTKYRIRDIPLTGFALEGFRQYPLGFSHLADKTDDVSTAIGKYLRENKLLPSKKHTVYSLRHSFQERLLAVNTPDRIQADLMGHKFQRPTYGDTTLKQKLEWMEKVQLDMAENIF